MLRSKMLRLRSTYYFVSIKRVPPFLRLGRIGRLESVDIMARVCCLAAVDPDDTHLLGSVLKGAGEPGYPIVARFDVAALGKLAPGVLIADIDRLEVDPLEALRQLRFVLPECVIVVYTAGVESSWGRACHLAGATCVLSKESRERQLTMGLRHALQTGCFTDPRFAA
jgi:CheY-like chemotaxis protein